MKEPLRCSECGTAFERPGSRGPVPTRCTECRAAGRRKRHAEEEARRQERIKSGRYRCGRCGGEKAGVEFPRSQRRDGGWCRACFRASYVERSGGMEIRSCAQCGDDFEVVKRSRRKFCSKRCKNRAAALRHQERLRESKRGRSCANCGEKISQDKLASARYCSEKCRKAHAGPMIRRRAVLKANYGLTIEDYEARLASQGGGCAICGAKVCPTGRQMSVDHDHATGRVRGILCARCNHGLGQFRDNPDLLRAAINYLKE